MDYELEKSTPMQVPFQQGKSYFFRTVTYHCLGRVDRIVGKFLVLQEASYVADTPRFADFLEKGEQSEVEPTGEHILNVDSIVDAFPWNHPLPDKQV